MTVSTIIKQVVGGKGALLIRDRKEEHVKGSAWQYDVKPNWTGNKKRWVYIDLFTASAMLTVFNALGDENKAKYDKVHIDRLIGFTWKHIK